MQTIEITFTGQQPQQIQVQKIQPSQGFLIIEHLDGTLEVYSPSAVVKYVFIN